MDTGSASKTEVGPDDRVRIRSIVELLQLLGVTKPGDVRVEEAAPPGVTSVLGVHPGTDEQLNWRPTFHARKGDDPSPRIDISRVEAETLLNAGAISVRH